MSYSATTDVLFVIDQASSSAVTRVPVPSIFDVSPMTDPLSLPNQIGSVLFVLTPLIDCAVFAMNQPTP